MKPLGLARIAIGLLLLVRTTPLLRWFPGLFSHHGGPLYGWPEGGLRAAVFGLVLPTLVIKGLVIARTLAAVSFTLGVFTRASAIVVATAGYLVWAQEPFTLIFTLHVLYLATLLLGVGDAAAVLALRPAPMRSPSSSVTLLRAFVVSIYAWSAVAKLRGPWLDGTILRAEHAEGLLSGPLADRLLASTGGARLTAWSVIGAELALGPLLCWRRTRAHAILAACALHAAFEVTAHPDVFGWVMVVLVAAAFTSRPPSDSAR